MDISHPHWIGLLATAILIATLTGQTVKQWRERATKGIARWFFLGQVSASLCFVVYSLLIDSLLFAVANMLILASAMAGYVVLRLNRRRALRAAAREREREGEHTAPRQYREGPHPRVAMM